MRGANRRLYNTSSGPKVLLALTGVKKNLGTRGNFLGPIENITFAGFDNLPLSLSLALVCFFSFPLSFLSFCVLLSSFAFSFYSVFSLRILRFPFALFFSRFQRGEREKIKMRK